MKKLNNKVAVLPSRPLNCYTVDGIEIPFSFYQIHAAMVEMSALGLIPRYGTPEDFDKYFKQTARILLAVHKSRDVSTGSV